MKKIIISIIVISCLLSASSLAMCTQTSTNGTHLNDNRDISTNIYKSCKYVSHIEYSNGESKDEGYIGSNPPTPSGESYYFYENFSGENIWNIVKVHAEQTFYLEEFFVKFSCDSQEDAGAIQFITYNPDTEDKDTWLLRPDLEGTYAIVEIKLHAWGIAPLSAGDWYFIFLAGNKINCTYNLTLVTSVPYNYSVGVGNGATVYHGTELDQSINIKNTLVGWYGADTPLVGIFFYLSYNKYSLTKPSGEKTTIRYLEYFRLLNFYSHQKI